MNQIWKKLISSTDYLDETDKALLKRAFEFSEHCHENQKRKSGEPYINHPLRVALTLAEIKSDSPSLIAALLHDVVEESNISFKEIEKRFGPEIAFLVKGLTKIRNIEYKGYLKEEKKHLVAQAENFRNMFLALAQDLRIVLIKLADRKDNLKTLWVLEPEAQLSNALETLEILAPLAYRLGLSRLGAELEDLAFPYAYPQEYRELNRLIGRRQEELKNYLEKIAPLLTDALKKENIHLKEVQYRAKHLYSIWRKLKKENMDISKVYDLVAIRFIVSNPEECYLALGAIHRLFKPVPGRIKDYIANPKPNGYQSLHTTVFGPEGRMIEIQIRDEKMHQEAEWGIASHWYYNLSKNKKTYQRSKTSAQFVLDKKFMWLKQLQEWQKEFKKPEDFIEFLKTDLLKDRIYVLTPKGDVLDLPDGATPIDFAYQIHTDVGNGAVGAKVNDKLVPLDYKLKSGDVVNILFKKGKKPSRSWLEFVKMKETKELIKKNLK